MSDLETKPTSPATGSCSGCEATQKQLNIVLIGLFVLSATFAVFLWRQTRYIRTDLAAMKPAAGQMIQGFNQEKPAVDAFLAKIAEYARTHPDFAPLAQKYQLAIPTNAPVAAPKAAPAAVPPPKK